MTNTQFNTDYAMTDPIRMVRQILNERLQALREKNDAAEDKDVIRNQGAIAELKGILKILSPLKPENQRVEWDGGFGD